MEYIKSAKARTSNSIQKDIAEIIQDVRKNGDSALLQYNKRFDGCRRESFLVTAEEIERAYRAVSPTEADDMRAAARNIMAFALEQKKTIGALENFEPSPGVRLGHRVIPVQSCCCYVPGGGYPLYSTALMLAIPAKIAGVGRVAACSPTMKNTESIHPKTLVAMDIAGVDEIYAVGGAHAIAAFAYGTRSIKPVDMIVGPGNAYVSEAKRQCYGQVGVDFIAGPSEVLIIADDTASAELIAADILAQSEHDALAKGILITNSKLLATQVLQEVQKQLDTLETAAIARQSWDDYGEILLTDTLDEAIALSNDIAPEHLEIMTKDAHALSEKLYNFGSLFIGEYTAEVFGDYASGTNHTLPTLRAARYTGGVYVGTFLKTCTYQSFSKDAMLSLAPLVSRLARGEGLAAHALAAEKRQFKFLK